VGLLLSTPLSFSKFHSPNKEGNRDLRGLKRRKRLEKKRTHKEKMGLREGKWGPRGKWGI